ncbi:MBL fold metallo-hydrolase [Gilvimarinus sp. F26214L]|uniref:MBL fold metallo-hydrolase n=1 Tax=Gilvimarinus sp. DZF01 TaxID=3461371 RepID=UPI0040454395
MADLHSSIIETEIVPGKPIRLSERVVRITAPNGGPMTGPGTNTYLVGTDEITVIDPGPRIDSHIEAILAAAQGKISAIAVTHTHPDHSPAAKPLAEATGATLYGSVLDDDGHQDKSFTPHVHLEHGHRISTPGATVEALYTPGHVGNHFCFYLQEEQIAFVGDHIMQGATVVIIPPSGDMLDYINSLKLLTRYPIDRLAPAHGHLIADAEAAVNDLIRHRMSREDKVVAALRQIPNSTLDQLMEVVYADVDKRLYKIAKLSLWAHLLKLEREGRAAKHAEKHWLFDDELWDLV